MYTSTLSFLERVCPYIHVPLLTSQERQSESEREQEQEENQLPTTLQSQEKLPIPHG